MKLAIPGGIRRFLVISLVLGVIQAVDLLFHLLFYKHHPISARVIIINAVAIIVVALPFIWLPVEGIYSYTLAILGVGVTAIIAWKESKPMIALALTGVFLFGAIQTVRKLVRSRHSGQG